ncbi:transposase [Natronomonas salsuginis]|uniref:Transposase n=1 Tax=Natronomonas salsuginis TaxID=2217661 RepID=A0A4U5JA97_9EURY|nr:transposase [Natronomonas salsuginis]
MRGDDEFECLRCESELHADYNAAWNIGWRLVQHWLKSGAGRANCQVALKLGTLNANGEFTTAESIDGIGSPRTCPPL